MNSTISKYHDISKTTTEELVSRINEIHRSTKVGPVSSGSSVLTHVCMGDYKSSHYIHRSTSIDFYAIWCELFKRNYNMYDLPCGGMAEITSNGFTPFFVDFDRKVLLTNEDSSPRTLVEESEVEMIIIAFQDYFKTYLEIKDDKYICGNIYDCSVFEKEPYIKVEKDGTRVIKHGFHLIFHNIFLSSENRKRVLGDIQEKFPDVDNCFNNPWLLYGAQKSKSSGTYKLSHVYTENSCYIFDFDEYFSNFNITDLKENTIKYDDKFTPTYFLPIMFSMSIVQKMNYRQCFLKPKPVLNEIRYEYNNEIEDFSDDYDEFKDEIDDIVREYTDDTLRISNKKGKKSKGNLIGLYRYKAGNCPVDDDNIHDNRGAYILLKNGSIIIGCGCCNVKKNIGKYKDTDNQSKYDEIMKKEYKERTEDENKYIDNIFNKHRERSIKKLTYIDCDNRVYRESKYVDFNDLLRSDKCIITKSALGSGKTTALTQ